MASLSPLLKQAVGITVVHGKGAYVEDEQGRRYLDFTSGIGVTSTGHCHPKVVEAIQRQAGELIHGQYTTVLHPRLVELTERLGTVLPAGLDSVFYANSGSEAIEAALRLARHATGRANVVVFHGSFHGRTVGAASLTTSRPIYTAGLQPLMAGVAVAPFPYAYRYGWDTESATAFCLRELDYLLTSVVAADDVAAMVVEPVLGEGGYVPAPPGFLTGLRERCDRHGILLVLDEVQTGIGRTGRMWGHEHEGVEPDALVTAKGLASGMPLSALAAPTALMVKARPGSQGGTYGGNAIACAAALATLAVIEEEELVARAESSGAHLLGLLEDLAHVRPELGDVRGLGLMVGVEFTGEDGALATSVQLEAAARGLLLLTCGSHGQVVRWIPPLVVTTDQLDRGVELFAEALDAAQTSSPTKRSSVISRTA